MTTIPIAIDDVGRLVRTLAITTKSSARPHPASNLVEPSLIAQLRSAIVPSSGSTGAGSKLPNERINLDAGALVLFNRLRSGISTLYEGTGRTAHGAPEELLIAWYVDLAVDHAAGDVDQVQLDNLYTRLDEWRTEIMDLFDPPERGDLRDPKTREPYPCPECGHAEVTLTIDGLEHIRSALVGIERPWRDEEGVKCRRCQTLWIGRGDMVELAADLGITVTNLHAPSAPTPEIALQPMWLCVMTTHQAHAFAKERSIPRTNIVVASGALNRLRGTTAPIHTATSENYNPGPHETARVVEAERLAVVINTQNGYTPSGHKPETPNQENRSR